VLTNSWIADPGSPIILKGGEIFSQPGTYKAIVEVTTMDNDKTDLPQPIRYDFNIPVARAVAIQHLTFFSTNLYKAQRTNNK
jgi:hypothetical protein